MKQMIKKTIVLNQENINRARLIFGVKSDKQAVNKALEMIAIDDDIISTHDQIGGKGHVIEEVFE